MNLKEYNHLNIKSKPKHFLRHLNHIIHNLYSMSSNLVLKSY